MTLTIILSYFSISQLHSVVLVADNVSKDSAPTLKDKNSNENKVAIIFIFIKE